MREITEDDIDYCDFLTYKYCQMWGVEQTDDIIQDAREAMCIAAGRYNENLEFKFITYAKKFILGAVGNWVITQQKGRWKRRSCVYANKLIQEFPPYFFEEFIGNARDMAKEYEKFDLVCRILEKMTPKLRGILIRHAIYGEKYVDISKEMGMRPQSAAAMISKWRLRSGYRGVKKCTKSQKRT